MIKRTFFIYIPYENNILIVVENESIRYHVFELNLDN